MSPVPAALREGIIVGMDVLAIWLQLVGNVITAGGLLYAWNRATNRFTQWRLGLSRRLAEVHQAVTSRFIRDSIPHVDAKFGAAGGLAVAVATGKGVVGTVEDRLAQLQRQDDAHAERLTAALASLPEQIDAAIDDKLGDLDVLARMFRRRDIYWSLGG